MRAIGLWQPWATLMAIGAKTVETRSWDCKTTGPLVIQATKCFPKEARELCSQDPFKTVLSLAGYSSWRDLPTGALVCVVNVREVQPTAYARGLPLQGHEREFGDYRDGRFAWMTNHLIRFNNPIPYKGSQGFFHVPDGLVVSLMSAAENQMEIAHDPR